MTSWDDEGVASWGDIRRHTWSISLGIPSPVIFNMLFIGGRLSFSLNGTVHVNFTFCYFLVCVK